MSPLLRLSLWLGYRRQKLIRMARAESARKGWQARRNKETKGLLR